MPTPAIAASAYAQAAKIADAAASITKAAGGGATAQDQGSFGAVLKQALADVEGAGAKSDGQVRKMAAGSNKADIIDVVTAVAETETAISTLVAVRDRVITAYQQIMQMTV
jgi:flagellar hook-basal body complex protein FliE